MALKIPSSLRLIDLKSLACKCGIASSGTKHLLIQRLHDEISSTPRVLARGTRILSIDMGIRNLAYCILDVPLTPTANPKPIEGTLVVKKGGVRSGVPSLRAWHRLAVSTAPVEENGTKVKEAFDPATLSKTAYTLLRERLLVEKPTHVLIERQRFRSMGSKHILEWTIRVNMFESILYAVLCTLQAEGIWEGQVVPVVPGRVGPFWLGNGDEEEPGLSKTRIAKSTKVQNKGQKIDLVRRWLEAGDVVALGNDEVAGMAKQYRDKWDRVPGGVKGRKRGEKSVETGKLDDLSDCLLQGMAWVSWEENKRTVLRHGVETLLEFPESNSIPKRVAAA
jgi:cruciform cutting endonuclease 1